MEWQALEGWAEGALELEAQQDLRAEDQDSGLVEADLHLLRQGHTQRGPIEPGCSNRPPPRRVPKADPGRVLRAFAASSDGFAQAHDGFHALRRVLQDVTCWPPH